MKFFKTFLASLLAVVVGVGLMAMMWTMIVVGIIASIGSTQTATISSGSVLRLNLGEITDSPPASIFGAFDFAALRPYRRATLLSTIQVIETAASDERIEGIYLNMDEFASVSLSSSEEIRAALVEFKNSGKFIVAFQDYYTQSDYWLASVADEVLVNPAGGVEWKGLSMQMMFYKGLLDKLGIEPVIVRHGKFKSAIEPFTAKEMSPENRLQNETLLASIWDFMLVYLSRDNVSKEQLQAFADNLSINSTQDALDRGLVDALCYEDEAVKKMTELIEQKGTKVGEKLNIVSFDDYLAQNAVAPVLSSKNKIAIVYAEGDIISGESADGSVGSATLARQLEQVRRDPDTKAMVLRINSPGGSALAAESMWREISLVKEKMPVVVSMGAVAASGGYYIAAPADVIYADQSTITGSIGVFGMFVNAGGALEDKLGITTDVVRSAAHADMSSPFRAPSSVEVDYFQTSVEQTYATFVDRVAKGRNMTPEAVDNIGQGRVWSGVDALEVGLIDGFGGIKEAIALAVDRGGAGSDFSIWEVSDDSWNLGGLFGGVSASIRSSVLKDRLGESFEMYDKMVKMLSDDGEVQARMPHNIEIR